MTTKPEFPDLNALAIEACDMWQDHLSTLASDPAARAELTRYLEPQRRLLADWATMMQQGMAAHQSPTHQGTTQQGGSYESHRANEKGKPADADAVSTAPATPQSSPSHGDDALRSAQLALRVAELEKRIAQLEARLAGASRRTQRASS